MCSVEKRCNDLFNSQMMRRNNTNQNANKRRKQWDARKKPKIVLFLAALVFMIVKPYGALNAMQFSRGEDTTVDCDITLNYGAGWRVSDRDDDKLANPNADDGNRNFDQWDMINNKVTLLADIDFRHKDFGIFVRPKAFYDYVYATDNAKNDTGTNNAAAFIPAGLPIPPVSPLVTDDDEWADDVEDKHGRNVEILDLFGYATFDLGNRLLELRVGKQVISWGESLFIQTGISSAQSHVDIAAAVAVGTEVKEILLPSESVFLQVDLTGNLALAAYYQWKWEKSKLMEGGTFFATSPVADALDDIEAPLLGNVPGLGLAPVVPRVGDDDASDSGQFGVALTYVWEWLNATEFGLYYINYHEKTPTLNQQIAIIPGVGPVPTGYFLSYTEDIKLYGASFSSQIWDANVSGEFAYRRDYVYQGAIGPGTEGNYWQAQTSWIYATAFDPVSDQITSIGEIGCVRTIGLDDDVFAWQYVLQMSLDWYQVIRALDVKLNLTYSDVPSGTTVPNLGFTEGVASGSVGFDFTYKTVYKAGIKYENRFNSVRNSGSDRDTLSVKLSYTF